MGDTSDNAASSKNVAFPLWQRVKDLFHFGSSGEDSGTRSGKISGNFSQSINVQNVGGNTSRSFLREGTNYVSELNLNIREKLWGDYQGEGLLFLRKTNNERIETEKDVRLKQVDVKIYNPSNLFEFGNFYADLSPFVLGSSLEGVNVEISPSSSQKYKFVSGRNARGDTAFEKIQPEIAAVKAEYLLFPDSRLFTTFRIGAQAAGYSDADPEDNGFSDADRRQNVVAGISGDMGFRNGLSLAYECASSNYYITSDTESVKADQSGLAFRLQPALTLRSTSIRYLYYYVQPKFYTETGSAASDRVQNRISIDHRFSGAVSLAFSENYYWDKLDGSLRAKRTVNNEQSLSLNLRPLDFRKGFMVRPYGNFLQRSSDDVLNTAGSRTQTQTVGFAVSAAINAFSVDGFTFPLTRAWICTPRAGIRRRMSPFPLH